MRFRTEYVLGLAFLLTACTDAPPRTNVEATVAPDNRSDGDAANDPAETTNRQIFAANMAVDRNVAKPVATAYKENVPDGIRHGVHNFVTNLAEPKVLVNDLLQANFTRAFNTTGRFVLNSTAGAGGLFDVAGRLGFPHHEADFGQTFGVWGVAPGPSVQIPLLGPSNVRDSVGGVLGIVADPLSFVPGGAMAAISGVGAGGGIVDARAEILDSTNELEKTSLDYYATLRSLSAQQRAVLVAEGRDGLLRADPGRVVWVTE